MIDELVELIDLTEAAKLCPGRPHSASLWRWARRGLKARNGRTVTLQHRRCGGRLFTTKEWLDTFFRQVSESDREHFDTEHVPAAPDRAPTPRARERQIEAAERRLAARGLL